MSRSSLWLSESRMQKEMGEMISINKTQNRVVLTEYIAMEERYAILWAQVVSSKAIVGIGYFMQNPTKSLTWVKTMRKRFIKVNENYNRECSKMRRNKVREIQQYLHKEGIDKSEVAIIDAAIDIARRLGAGDYTFVAEFSDRKRRKEK